MTKQGMKVTRTHAATGAPIVNKSTDESRTRIDVLERSR